MKKAKTLLLALSLLFLGCEKEKFVPRITPNVKPPANTSNAEGISLSTTTPNNTTVSGNSSFDFSISVNKNYTDYSLDGNLNFYSSTDSVYSSNDTKLNISSSYISISSYSYSDTETISFTTPATNGKYYVIAVFSYYVTKSGSSGTPLSKAISYTVSDKVPKKETIEITNTTFDYSSYNSGSAISITYNVKNNSKTGNYISFDITNYFSTDSSYSSNDTKIDDSYSNSTYSTSTVYSSGSLPDGVKTDTYYIITKVTYTENYTSKTYYISKPISVTYVASQLVFSNATLNKTTYTAGEVMSGTISVQNNTNNSINNSVYLYFLTDTTSTYNSYYDDQYLSFSTGTNTINLSNFNVSSNLTAGTTYYIKAQVYYNSKYYNKVVGSFSVVPTIITINGLNLSNTSYALNSTLQYTFDYNGANISSYVYRDIDFYLSSDNTYSSGDIKINTNNDYALVGGQRTSSTVNSYLSGLSLTAGNYYLIARINNGTTSSPEYSEFSSSSTINLYEQGTVVFNRNTVSNQNRYVHISGSYAGYINFYSSYLYSTCSEFSSTSTTSYFKVNKTPGTYTYSITDSSTPGFGTIYQSGSFTVTNNSCEIINITL